jgi:hypothetical protein
MNKIKSIIFLSPILCTLLGLGSAISAQRSAEELHVNLKINVKDLDVREGRIMIAVYNSPNTFLKKAFKTSSIAVDSLSVPSVGINLPQGVYAVSLFHDTNKNGRLDLGSFGIPTEKYGFSNNTEGFMGPPSFKSSSFRVVRDTTITITLQ